MEQLILNLDQGNYFRYDETEVTYEILLLERLEFGHWERTDKIIKVPMHLQTYVEKKYGEIFI